MAIAQALCTPCECTENEDDEFLLKLKASGPKIKTCAWLGDLDDDKIFRICKKFDAYDDILAARFVCPITCKLPQCEP